MKQKKVVAGLALGISVLFSSFQCNAMVMDFEGVPQTYWYASGNQNLGNYYAGVTFGSDATILEDQVYGYNSSYYPAHSGHAVLFSATDNNITAQFSTLQQSVSLWYTTAYDLTLSAYDASNNLIAQSVGTYNLGTNAQLAVSAGSPAIDHIVISGTADGYTIDDISAVPEPSTSVFMGIGGLGIAGMTYKKRKTIALS
jgi:hypothetical protein